MAEQKKKKREEVSKKDQNENISPDSGTPTASPKDKEVKEDLDDLLDEIDDILEEDAEEFVKSYVQRGGE